MKITQNWKDLDKSKYIWDKDTKTFSTNENDLVLDFSDMYWVTFKTGPNCTFNTGYNWTFKTGSNCTFDTDYDCTFKTGKECVVIRRDLYEVIELEEWEQIKLNWYRIKWFTKLEEKKEIIIDWKTISLSLESYEELKKSLID